ncbi:MAG: nucleotidyltransferase domain-containing protein [Candidatus Woesearchaeota archaeon]
MIWKNIKLNKSLKVILKGKPNIEDIILFGSIVRGKDKPGDIDILVLFKDKVNKEDEYLIRKELENHFKNLSIISKTINSLYDPAFDAREAVLFEGISLISGKKMTEKFGLSSVGMFKYHFQGWSKLTKTKFYHAFNGRNGLPGFSADLGAIKLSDGMVLVPLNKIEAMKGFLSSWNLSYQYFPLLLPDRFNKKSILEG